ncbi:MAG: flagellar hook-length control protein FliK [Hasllibacter sp.]
MLPRTAREAIAAEGLRLVRMEGGRADIRLDPPELGQVRMTVSVTEGAISVTITAERAETLDLLRRHSEQLMQMLRGEDGTELDARFGAAADERHARRGEGPPPEFPTSEPSPDADRPAPARAADGRLDLRF